MQPVRRVLGCHYSTAENWLGVPMFFGGIGPEATRQAVAAAGLEVEGWETVSEDEGDGKVVSFLWITARRPPIDASQQPNPLR
jgi:hypothetical protein